MLLALDAIMTHGMGNGALPAPPVPPAPSTFPRNKKAQSEFLACMLVKHWGPFKYYISILAQTPPNTPM